MRASKPFFFTHSYTKVAVFLMLAAFVCRALFSYAEVVDKIVVIVNDEIITQGELYRILNPIYKQYEALYSGQELEERKNRSRDGVLARLIQDKLLLSEAKRREVVITDKEMEAKIKEAKKGFANDREFERALLNENLLLSEFKRKHRERLMTEKLIDSEIKRRIAVTPTEVMRFYEKNKTHFKTPPKRKVRSILVRITAKEPENSARKIAEKVRKRLSNGEDFAALAKEYSKDSYAASGGDMGWVKAGDLMPKINDLIFSLKENEVSEILKTDLGFHIFKVLGIAPSEVREFNQVKKQAEQLLFNQKIQIKLGQWIQELRKDAYIAYR